MKKVILAATVALIVLPEAKAEVRHTVCTGPIMYVDPETKQDLRVWIEGGYERELVYWACKWDSDTQSGKLIQRVCGRIIDNYSKKLVCRIEGTFETLDKYDESRIKMKGIKAEKVTVRRKR